MTNEEAIKYLKQLYPNGGHCWLDEQRIEAIGMAIKALQKEPASENLEEAANEYAKDYLFTPKPQRAPNIHFINGANWQKEQLMAKAVDVTIAIPYQNGYGGYTQLVDSKEGLPFGENLKVLVIKED